MILEASLTPEMHRNPRIMRNSTDFTYFHEKAEIAEIHDFLSTSRLGVAEPSRNLPRRYDYKGFATPGERRHPLQRNIVNSVEFI